MLREFLPEKESDVYFNDHNQISDWARESIYFCIPWGVLSGYENSTYRPKGNLTRAEACTILSKVLDLIR